MIGRGDQNLKDVRSKNNSSMYQSHALGAAPGIQWDPPLYHPSDSLEFHFYNNANSYPLSIRSNSGHYRQEFVPPSHRLVNNGPINAFTSKGLINNNSWNFQRNPAVKSGSSSHQPRWQVKLPHPKRGTVTCRHWMRGRCDLGDACNFKHAFDHNSEQDPAVAYDLTRISNLQGDVMKPDATLKQAIRFNPGAVPFTPTEGVLRSQNLSTPTVAATPETSLNWGESGSVSSALNVPTLDFAGNKRNSAESDQSNNKLDTNRSVVREGTDPLDWLISENTPRKVR